MHKSNQLSFSSGLRWACLLSFICWCLAWAAYRVAIPGEKTRFVDPTDPAMIGVFAVILGLASGLICLPVTFCWLRRWPKSAIWALPFCTLALSATAAAVAILTTNFLYPQAGARSGSTDMDVFLWITAPLAAYHLGCLLLMAFQHYQSTRCVKP